MPPTSRSEKGARARRRRGHLRRRAGCGLLAAALSLAAMAPSAAQMPMQPTNPPPAAPPSNPQPPGAPPQGQGTPSPQIIVQPISAPAVTVQVPQPDPLKTWLPVGVAILSAMVAAFSAFLAWRNQNFGFQKDRAAVIRDIRSKQAAAALQAYENNVARPVGAVLDLVERMINDVSKIRTAAPAYRADQLKTWGASVIADQANGERLCDEADGALTGNPPRAVFAPLFVRRGLDSLFLEAITEALSVAPQGAAFDRLKQAVKDLKVEMRGHLESERQAEATRWIGEITDDPFYPEIEHLLKAPPHTS